ncbi:GPN-loop GTPase [Blyttiomyces helicus]|uniref:GPN-loop GTPase 3 n=1 Tax=Blyttiomyces helicus TaxID=388810 RepID=A0A4P9WH16_9FUNG|nr:GPN-loop GTPase [Blyttiomyces helicus]|eukprot:RKO92014.1 GPN-loop GTPase [Blyttiomyces helicus]
MGKFAVFVIGPAGTGKTTFCATMQEHLSSLKKESILMNLDPAAITAAANIDIRHHWPLEEIMNEYSMGPNGGLIKCVEMMVSEANWLESSISGYGDEFMFVDCPGQIELYMHSDVMQKIIGTFAQNDYSICVVFLLDSQFLQDSSKFLAGILNSLSAMLQLELPHVNIITKMDLLGDISDEDYDNLQKFFYPDTNLLKSSERENMKELDIAISALIENFNLVEFCPLNITDRNSIEDVLVYINNVLQNDDLDVSGPDYIDFDKT